MTAQILRFATSGRESPVYLPDEVPEVRAFDPDEGRIILSDPLWAVAWIMAAAPVALGLGVLAQVMAWPFLIAADVEE